jgi:hypothetical protein
MSSLLQTMRDRATVPYTYSFDHARVTPEAIKNANIVIGLFSENNRVEFYVSQLRSLKVRKAPDGRIISVSNAPGVICDAGMASGDQTIAKVQVFSTMRRQDSDTEAVMAHWRIGCKLIGEALVLRSVTNLFRHLVFFDPQLPVAPVYRAPALSTSYSSIVCTLEQFAQVPIVVTPELGADVKELMWYLDELRKKYALKNSTYETIYGEFPQIGQTASAFQAMFMYLPRMRGGTLSDVFRMRALLEFESPGAFLSSVVVSVMCTLHVMQTRLSFMHGDLHTANIYFNRIPAQSAGVFTVMQPWRGTNNQIAVMLQTRGGTFYQPVIADYDQSNMRDPATGVEVCNGRGLSPLLLGGVASLPPKTFSSGSRLHPMTDLWRLAYALIGEMLRFIPHLILGPLALSVTANDGAARMVAGQNTATDDMQAFFRLLFLVLDRRTDFVAMSIPITHNYMQLMSNYELLKKTYGAVPLESDPDNYVVFSAAALNAMHNSCLGMLAFLAGGGITTTPMNGAPVPAWDVSHFDSMADAVQLLQIAPGPATYSVDGDHTPVSLLLHDWVLKTGVVQIGLGDADSVRSYGRAKRTGSLKQEIIDIQQPDAVQQYEEVQAFYTEIEQR